VLIDAKQYLSIKYSVLVEKVCRVHKFALVFDISDFKKAKSLKTRGKCRAHAANNRQPASISHYLLCFWSQIGF